MHLTNVRHLSEGSTAPDFEVHSTSGPFRFYQWSGGSWVSSANDMRCSLILSTLQTIIFSHPGFAFVTEITEVARRLSDIEQRDVKVVAFSRNWFEENEQWNMLLQQYRSGQSDAEKNIQIVCRSRYMLSDH